MAQINGYLKVYNQEDPDRLAYMDYGPVQFTKEVALLALYVIVQKSYVSRPRLC